MTDIAAGERPGGFALGALVFGAGIGALATEITASRLLAPYFGSSTIVWANLIGIVLGALALGYWLGGRLADRRPEPRLLGAIVLAAAAFIAVIPFAAKPFLDYTVEGLDTASAGAVIGSFLAVLLLCAPPVVLLGMVSPFAIRLAVSSIATAGAVAGRLYALSTAGSLVGTFLPALVLIPAIGTQRTFLVIAVLVAATSCFMLGARYLLATALIAGLLVVSPGAIKAEAGLIHEETSPYQYIGVVERPDGAACPASERGRRDPLRLAGRLRPDGWGVGRVSRRSLRSSAVRSSVSRFSATPAGRPRARSGCTTPRRRSTASSSIPPSVGSAFGTSAWATTLGSWCMRSTPDRSCARPTSATTSSSSTRIGSRTSRSTSRPASSSVSSAIT